MSKSSNTVKHCVWFAQRNYYYETHDANGNKINESEAAWRNRVIEEIATVPSMVQKGIQRIYLIFHDMDKDKNGKSMELHCHFVVWFKDSDVWDRVHRKLGCSDHENNCIHPDDKVESLRYLTHVSKDALNSGYKHIYDSDKVIAVSADQDKPIVPYLKVIMDSERQKAREKKSANDKTSMIQKSAKANLMKAIAIGQMTIKEVRSAIINDIPEVGFTMLDWLHEEKYFEQAEQEYLSACCDFYRTNPYCLTTVYISGSGGQGKSVLGLTLANACFPGERIHTPAIRGERTTFDFAGDYRGEKVTLINEFGSGFNVPQFLDVFDPIHVSSVNSRYKDKVWFARMAILPSSETPEKSIYNMWINYAKESLDVPIINNLIDLRHHTNNYINSTLCQNLREIERINPEITEKISQLRRRIPIWVDLLNDGYAYIYCLCLNNNHNHITLFDANYRKFDPNDNQSPYLSYTKIPYHCDDDDSVRQTVQAIICAIKWYYSQNGLTVRPEMVKKPTIKI